MDEVCAFPTLLPFAIGFGVPAIYVLTTMAYRLRYDFDAVVSRRGGVTNTFTSISRATASSPWSVGWVLATVVHLICNLWINGEFTDYWDAREHLLPHGQRDAYRRTAEFARHLHWLRAAALVLVSAMTTRLSEKLHFTSVTIFLTTDFFYHRYVDHLEGELFARVKDPTVACSSFHHRTSNNVMTALSACLPLSLVLHLFGRVSYAHSAFGLFELVYGACHGWHDFITSVVITRQAYLACADHDPGMLWHCLPSLPSAPTYAGSSSWLTWCSRLC